MHVCVLIMFWVCADYANVCADYVPNMSDIRHTFDTHDFVVCSQFLHNGQTKISLHTICTVVEMTSKEQSLARAWETLKVFNGSLTLAGAGEGRGSTLSVAEEAGELARTPRFFGEFTPRFFFRSAVARLRRARSAL